MKILVLGSGGFGYPLVFCECENCNKARTLGGKNIRKRASILINDEMIIDLTGDTSSAMTMYNKNMGNVKYLLQTHTHLDHFDINHFTSLDYKYATKRNSDLNLICSSLALKDINEKANQYDKMNLLDRLYLNKIKLKTYELNHGETLNISNYTIKAIHCSHHEAIGAQIYLIKHQGKCLLYATDTPMITEIALNELKGETIDCVILDETFGNNDYSFGHLNLEGFVEYIEQLKANKLLNENCEVYATHIIHDGNPCHDELEEILNKYGYHASYDGMEINL